jgi:outer membrane protein assembly factor BamD
VYKAILIFLSIFIISCSSNDKEDIISDQSLYKNNLLEDYELYERANIHISNNQLNLALTELKKIEVLFPSSKFANKGMLVTAYINFLKKDYEKTRAIAESYKEYYPGSKDIVYANYLDAMTYYIQLKKPNFSQKNTITALEKFNFILNAYPNSKYQIDIITKVQIIDNNLAANKLATAKYYLNKQNYNGALVYLKDIFENHNSSLSIQETIYLIVEVYYLFDEKDLARYYASVLAYNFPESDWYKRSYNLINNIKNHSNNDKSWFKRYNPVKIFNKKQEEENIKIQRID